MGSECQIRSTSALVTCLDLGAAACRGGCHRQHLARRAVGGFFLPADRTEWTLQHAANADRIRTEMKIDCALMQRAFGLRRAVALAQIIEPGRTMIAFGP